MPRKNYKKNSIFLSVVLLLSVFELGLSLYGSGIRKVEFPDLLVPSAIYADSEQFYIVDKNSVCIFSRSDFKFVRKFGETGEGPQQFKSNPGSKLRLTFNNNMLGVSSIGKLSYFKKDGTFISEVKHNQQGQIYPFAHQFVMMGEIATGSPALHITVFLVNPKYEKLKALIDPVEFPMDGHKKTWRQYFEHASPHFYNGHVYLANGNEMRIFAYNPAGKRVLDISYDYQRPKVTNDHILETKRLLKEGPNGAAYGFFKNGLIFPEYFPAISDMRIADEKIYVETYRQMGEGKLEFVVFTTGGKFVEKATLPICSEHLFEHYPYTIIDGTLYQLVEDVNDETWFMHITPISTYE